jgi:chromosome segregation ATPase
MPEDDFKGKKTENVIAALIKHANSLEQQMSTLEEKISELNDLQLLNKLDIINLKNEIEKMRLTVPAVSPETTSMIHELEKLAEKTGDVKKLRDLAGDVDRIEHDIKKLKESSRPSKFPVEKINAIEKRVEENKRKLSEVGKRVHREIKRCGKCHTILVKDARFCGNCGKRVKP